MTGDVERLDFPDRGIVRVRDDQGEQILHVKGVLPGQRVQCLVTKKRSGSMSGRLLSVLSEAPGSVPSLCPHFKDCGGCAYLTLPYEESALLKEAQVKRLLSPLLSIQKEAPVWERLLTSPVTEEYRNKMEFTFGDAVKDGPLSLGLHKRGSFHDIVSVTDCRLVDADYRRILSATLSFFSPLYERGEVTYYHRMRQSGWLRHLLVRKARGTGEILVDLVTTSEAAAQAAAQEQGGRADTEALLAGFRNTLLSLAGDLDGRIAGILHTTNDAAADAVIDGGTKLLYGTDFFEEQLLGLSFRVTAFSFFQTNSAGAEVLYETVRRYVREACALTGEVGEDIASGTLGTVYDLYCGTGTITQLLSPVAKRVVGVELVAEAVAAAKESAARNGIGNCEFLSGDVLKLLDELTERPDLIVLDPPRDGIHPKALPKILSYGVPHIIYVSCKPTSLARDLPVFRQNGYEATRLVCVDQFPWTRHVETIVMLSQIH